MMRLMCKSKIAGGRVTFTNVEYNGSIGIDEAILREANILPYEMVLVIDVDNTNRFETYTIPEKAGSGNICVYGGAAKLTKVGNELILISSAYFSPEDLESFSKPRVVRLDERNRVKTIH